MDEDGVLVAENGHEAKSGVRHSVLNEAKRRQTRRPVGKKRRNFRMMVLSFSA